MKFVILSNKMIPEYNVKGPIFSPAEYDLYLVLRWIMNGIDIREVMDDGTYRKLSLHDERLLSELHGESEKKIKDRSKKLDEVKADQQQHSTVRLKPEKKQKVPQIKKTEKPKKENKVVEKAVEKENIEFFIDELEKPE